MRSTTTVLLLAVVAAALTIVASAKPRAESFSFTGNLTTMTADFTYRNTDLISIPLTKMLLYYSVTATATAAQTPTANIDTIFSLITADVMPAAVISYFKGDVSTTLSFQNLDFKGGVGLLANSWLMLQELKADGSVVRAYNFAALHWSVSSVQKSGDDLKSVVLSAPLETTTIYITIIVSKIVGVIDYANAVVSPKSLEMVFELADFPYTDPSNHLQLTLAAMTGDANFDGTAIISATSGNQLYLTLNNQAIINGQSVNVDISKYLAVDYTKLSNIDAIKAFFAASPIGKNFQARLVNISFPAAAKSIVYDPAVGQGALPYGSGSSKSGLNGGEIFAIVLFCGILPCCAAVLIVIAVIRHKRGLPIIPKFGKSSESHQQLGAYKDFQAPYEAPSL